MTCPKCQGTGYQPLETGGISECMCKLRERALKYLTPVYAEENYITKLNADLLKGNFILNSSQNPKSLIKSFLLNSGMIYTHQTVSAYDIIQAYLTNSEEKLYNHYRDVGMLVVFLIRDPKNVAYGQVISSLLQSRILSKKITWIVTQNPIHSEDFKRMYGSDLSEFLEAEKFKLLK